MIALKIIGVSLVGVSLLLMLVFLLRKNESFFNLNSIIKQHLSLFRNCKLQYIVFYILPLTFSIGLAMIYEADITFYSELSVIVSIFLSMLLAIMSILTGMDYGKINIANRKDKIKLVVNETITAIIFNGLLCILLLLFCLVMIVVDKALKCHGIINSVLAGCAYYIFVIIILTLLLIVKRMSKIIDVILKS